MSQADNFLIGRIVFDLDFHDQARAKELQNKISLLYHRSIQAVLEEVADRHLRPGLLYRLNTLTLDLDGVLYDELDETLPAKIREAFSKILSDLEAAGKDRGRQNGLSVVPLATGKMDIVRHFLLHGAYPWWGRHYALAPIDELIGELAGRDKDDFRAVLMTEGQSENVRRRIASQLRTETIHRIVNVLEPAEAGFIIGFHSGMVKMHAEEPVVRTSAEDFALELWAVILRFLIAPKGSEFSRKEFIRDNLRRLAAQFSIYYADLLRLIDSTLHLGELDFLDGTTRSLLRQVLAQDMSDRKALKTPARKDLSPATAKYASLESFLQTGILDSADEHLTSYEIGVLLRDWLQQSRGDVIGILAKANLDALLQTLRKIAGGEQLLQMLINVATRHLPGYDAQLVEALVTSGSEWQSSGNVNHSKFNLLQLLLRESVKPAGNKSFREIMGTAAFRFSRQFSVAGREAAFLEFLQARLPTELVLPSLYGANAMQPEAIADKSASNAVVPMSALLSYYFRHGAFPWWADEAVTKKGFAVLADAYARQQPKDFSRLLSSAIIAGGNAVLKRISYQVAHGLLAEVVTARFQSTGALSMLTALSEIFTKLRRTFTGSFVWDEYYLWEKLLTVSFHAGTVSFDRRQYLSAVLRPVFNHLGISLSHGIAAIASWEAAADDHALFEFLRSALSSSEGSITPATHVASAQVWLDDFLEGMSSERSMPALLGIIQDYLNDDMLPAGVTILPGLTDVLMVEVLRRLAARPEFIIRLFKDFFLSPVLHDLIHLRLSTASAVDRSLLVLWEVTLTRDFSGTALSKSDAAALNVIPSADQQAIRDAGRHPVIGDNTDESSAAALLRYYFAWQQLPDTTTAEKPVLLNAARTLKASVGLLFSHDRQALHSLLASAVFAPASLLALIALFRESAGGTERLIAEFLAPYRASAQKILLLESGPEDVMQKEDGAIELNSGTDILVSADMPAPGAALDLLAYFLRWCRMPDIPGTANKANVTYLVRLVQFLFRTMPDRLAGLLAQDMHHPVAAMDLRKWVTEDAANPVTPTALTALFNQTLTRDLILLIRDNTHFTGRNPEALKDWLSQLAWSSPTFQADFWQRLTSYKEAFATFIKILLEARPGTTIAGSGYFAFDAALITEIDALKRLMRFEQLPQSVRTTMQFIIDRELLAITLKPAPGLYLLSARIARAAVDEVPQTLAAMTDAFIESPMGVSDSGMRLQQAKIAALIQAALLQHKRQMAGLSTAANSSAGGEFSIDGGNGRHGQAIETIDEAELKKEEGILPPPLDKYSVGNAGLILLHPFFPTYFNRLGMLADGRFIDEAARLRGVQLLQYLATGGAEHEEHHLPLNKLLCGLQISLPVPRLLDVTEGEKALTDELFGVLFSQWAKMKNSTIDGFRQSFILREGMMERREESWTMVVEQRGYDVLLATSPWAFGNIKTPWMEQMLYVDWPY